MSSTYVHYLGPSSLPSDYAIVSRANAHQLEEEDESDGRSTPTVGGSRRASVSEQMPHRRQKPTIGKYPFEEPTLSPTITPSTSNGLLSENTPLLSNPPIPRIEESLDRDPSSDSESKSSMFWEELVILSKYALPVFGCVFALIAPTAVDIFAAEPTYWSTLSLSCP